MASEPVHTPSIPVPPHGSRREVLSMAWPIWISMISVTVKGTVDMMMVGSLGADELAGVGLAGILAFNVICFGMGVLRGQKALVSQYLGAGDTGESFRYGMHGFYLACIFAAICLAAAFSLSEPFLALAGGSELSQRAMAAGSDYFDMRLAWAGSMFLYLAAGEYLRATERTRMPMIADLVSQPLNILLNYALIFGHFGCPELGVAGAAIGTGLSDLASLALLLALSWKTPSRKLLSLSPRRLWRALGVGSASGIQMVLEIGSFSLVTYFISILGTDDTAAHAATISILHFSFMSAIAIGDGGSVLVGKYVGALDWEAAERSLGSMLRLNILVMLACGAVFVLFGEGLMGLYLEETEPVAIGKNLLIIAALWQLGDAFQISYRFALRAAGDHNWVMWTGILTAWLLTVPSSAFAIWFLEGDVVTVWWCWNLPMYFGAWLFRRRWKSGRWRELRLVEDQVPAP